MRMKLRTIRTSGIFLVIVLGWIGCATSDFRAAEEMVRQRKFYNAMEFFLSFAGKHSEHRRAPEALFRVGSIQQLVLDEPKKALESYRLLVSSYPVNDYTIQAQRRIAEIQKNNVANYHQAVVEYEKLLRAAPNHSEAPRFQFEIAQCYTLLHKYEQASLEYQVLIEKYPNYKNLDEVFFHVGNNAYIEGKYRRSIEAYETVVNRFPKSAFAVQAVFGSASAHEELDEFSEAEERYLKVQTDYPAPRVVEIRLKGLKERREKKNRRKPGVPIR